VLGGAIDQADPAGLREADVREIEAIAASARRVDRGRRVERECRMHAGAALGIVAGLTLERAPLDAVGADQHLGGFDEDLHAGRERVLEHHEIDAIAVLDPGRIEAERDASATAERGHVEAAHAGGSDDRRSEHDVRQLVVTEVDAGRGRERVDAIGEGVVSALIVDTCAFDRRLAHHDGVVAVGIVIAIDTRERQREADQDDGAQTAHGIATRL
jgi:hypothetical protein